MTYHDRITAYKREVLTEAMREANGVHATAAKALGVNRTYLYRLLKMYGVERANGKTA